ncbi:hypothetical protein [Leclercia sp. J807]|uniref:hypothetical protein n=1 Tax=Leclercia sp. J807 TaxID=2681307 RepID=UPI001E51F93C|nr:hypothetical protein [Leclercia sp. J807]
MSSIDLSGQSPAQPQQTPPPSGLTPPTTPPSDNDPDILIRRDVRDGMERRGMRLILSITVLIFAVMFLWQGLFFALKVGNGLLQAKSSIVEVLTKKSEKEICQPSTKCVESEDPKKSSQSTPSTDKNESTIPPLSTDWLSASSLIAIVAFILGVGLTLILTLLKSAFHHPTDKNLNGQKTTDNIELATPLSELIMGMINYLKNKFSK